MATVTSSKRHLVLTSDTYTSNGDVVVGGDLTIQGTTTTLDTANLLVEDKNIIIGNVSSPSDTTADGGGITLKGATDKTISWSNANNRWDFNQGITSSGNITAANISGSTSGTNTGDQDLSGYSTTSHNHDGRYLRTHARYQDDLDTITTSGVYIWDVSEADDEPTGASDGLLTIKYWDSSDWATASFQDFHNRKLYIKSKKSGNWQTDWAQVWTTDQLTTTNKTNYDTAYTHSQATHAPTDAEANVQADWTEATTTSDAFILNKPTIPSDFVSAANGGTFLGPISTPTGSTFAGAIKITETGTAQHILIGNQDSGGTDKPAMIQGVNGQLNLGFGSSWSSEGGTMTDTLSLDISNNATFAGNIVMADNATVDGVDISALPTSFAPTDAEANVQANWTATSGDALILNKPTIPPDYGAHNGVYLKTNYRANWIRVGYGNSGGVRYHKLATLVVPSSYVDYNATFEWTGRYASGTAGIHLHSDGNTTAVVYGAWYEDFNPTKTLEGTNGWIKYTISGDTVEIWVKTSGWREFDYILKDSVTEGSPTLTWYNENTTTDQATEPSNLNAFTNRTHTAAGYSTATGVADNAEVNVQADWTATSGDALILNKPTIPTDFVSAANGGSFDDAITINKDGDALNLRSVTNGQPANLTFSTNVPDAQVGHIKYTHSNSASYGSGEAFIIGGTESSTTIFADGKLMYAEGIYSKPSSGTGAGTRRDSNWNTAYTHSQATHAPTDAEANVQADWNATSGDALILNKPSIPAASGKGQNINYIQSNLPSSDTTYRDNFGAGVWAYSGYSTGSDRPTTYDATLQVMPNANLGFEISTGWHSTGEGKIKIRALRDCCEGWGSYYDVWTSANFTPSSFISATSADTASELITFSKGISSDGDAKFYNWRALDNTSNSTDFCHRIARITGTQSTRFVIEIAGRQSSYSDNSFPAFGKIVGQLNNDHNYDITFYNFTIGTEVEAVLEVGQLDVNTTQTDIYIRHGQYAELTATAHISDGSITTYSNDSGATGTPVGYVQSSEVEVWNSSNDGSGSGMDADYVDGLHASSFIRSDADDTASGTYTFTGSAKFALDSTFSNSEVRFPATTDQNPTMMFYRPTGSAATSYPWRFQGGGGGSSSSFYIGTGSGANNGSETIANKLSISSTGTLTVSGDVIAYGSPSDAKYKENVKPIENALGKVMDLEGVSFDWKENSEILDIKEDIGFIAQDVQKVIPELVKENEDGNLSLRYQGLIPVLLEAMKEQQKQIDELKSQMAVSNKRACNCKK
jgi:hypothetical protein